MLIKNVRDKGGTGKLKSYWEPNLFKVKTRDKNLPVYSVENVNRKNDIRLIHRNLMMKANDLPAEFFSEQTGKQSSEQKRKKKDEKEEVIQIKENLDSDVEDSDIVIITHGETNPVEGGGSRMEDEDQVEMTLEENEESIVSTEAKAQHELTEEIIDVEDDVDATGFKDDNIDTEEVIHTESESEEEFYGFGDGEDSVVEMSTQEEAEVDGSTMDGESESDEGSPRVCRRSSRNRQKRKIFTYNQVGGNPVNE